MKVVLAFLVAIALAGCQFITPEKVDKTIDTSLPIVCAGVDLAWLSFEAYKGSNKVKADLVVKAQAAYFAAKKVCSAPPTNTSEALIAVLRAASDFNSVIKAAKNVNTAGTTGTAGG
jgi:hypothetical protein